MKHLFTKYSALFLLTSAMLSLALAACGPSPQATADATAPLQQPTTVAQPADNGYPAATSGQETGQADGYPPPAPTTAVDSGPYPPPTLAPPTPVQSYPEQLAENTPENGILFAFERPIAAGDTVIRGVGPAGVEISVMNVTFMGELVATTTIDDDGRFEVTVPALEPGIRLGLTADIQGSDLEQRIVPGEGAVSMPQVGYFYDSVVIFAE